MSFEREPIDVRASFSDISIETLPPMSWGKKLWITEGVASPEPPTQPDDPFHPFVAIIRLAPLEARLEPPLSWSVDWLIAGDSNYRIPGTTDPREMTIVVGRLTFSVNVQLHANAERRLAAILVDIPAAQRATDAYRAARGVFDALQMQVCFDQELPLREHAIAAFRDGGVAVLRYSVGFPTLDFNVTGRPRSPILQRLIAPYADALQSPTGHYSFLVYFALLEFMLSSWIGAVRRAYERRGSALPKRSYTLDDAEISSIMPWLRGVSFHEYLTRFRHLRNSSGGGHFSFSVGPRAGTVVTDDELAAARDVLKLAVRKMIDYADADITSIRQLEATDELALAVELQSYIDVHNGHLNSKSRTRGARQS